MENYAVMLLPPFILMYVFTPPYTVVRNLPTLNTDVCDYLPLY